MFEKLFNGIDRIRENQVKKRIEFSHKSSAVYLSFDVVEINEKTELYMRMYYDGESQKLVKIDNETAKNIVDALNKLRIEVYGD